MSLFGCSASLKEAKPLKEHIPYAVSEEPSIKHEGSLWQDNGSLSELFIDPTARRVGDIVTIQIVESGVSIGEVVKALNALSVSPRDLISIFQAIKAAGALQAKLEII